LSYQSIRGSFFPVYINGYTATKDENQSMDYADLQAAQFNDADVVVLTMPMWNFSVPAIMKAWMDQIMLPGKVFNLDKDDGPMPLHDVKKLVLLVASGGIYKEGDLRDSLSTQIERMFGWIGIEDIGVAWADGQDSFLYNDTEAHKQFAMEAAQELAEDVAELAQ
jgi:FMN-dependent NADH-azoreductase